MQKWRHIYVADRSIYKKRRCGRESKKRGVPEHMRYAVLLQAAAGRQAQAWCAQYCSAGAVARQAAVLCGRRLQAGGKKIHKYRQAWQAGAGSGIERESQAGRGSLLPEKWCRHDQVAEPPGTCWYPEKSKRWQEAQAQKRPSRRHSESQNPIPGRQVWQSAVAGSREKRYGGLV